MRDESIMAAGGGPGSVALIVYLNVVIKLNGIVLTKKKRWCGGLTSYAGA